MANYSIKLLGFDKEFITDKVYHDRDDYQSICFVDKITKNKIKTNDRYIITALKENEENDKK